MLGGVSADVKHVTLHRHVSEGCDASKTFVLFFLIGLFTVTFWLDVPNKIINCYSAVFFSHFSCKSSCVL